MMIALITNGTPVETSWEAVLLELFKDGYTLEAGKLLDADGQFVQALPAAEPAAALALPGPRQVMPIVDVAAAPTARQAVSGYDLVVVGDRVERRWRVVDLPQPSLAEVKAQLCAKVDALRDARISAGVKVTFPDGVATIQTRDAVDLQNASGVASQGLAALVAQQSATFVYRDAANVVHAMTPAEAVDFGRQVATAVQAVYTASWSHKDAINNPKLTDLATLQTYDVTAGWPGA